MTKRNYSFDVLINGSTVKEYSGPNGTTYIEGKKGSEFTLRIQNNSSNRILAVITVDGLSVIDGKPASFKSQGYILDPWTSQRIPGWRLNNSEVAKFYFDTSGDSYAAKQGEGNNIGVIGCAIFEEDYFSQPFIKTFRDIEKKMDEIMPWPSTFPRITWTDNTWNGDNYTNANTTMFLRADSGPNVTSCSNCSNAGYSKEVERGNNIGTGFGKPQEHKVVESTFRREDKPTVVMEINYDDRDGLKAKGVYIGSTNQVSAFPEETSYCQPPKDWKK